MTFDEAFDHVGETLVHKFLDQPAEEAELVKVGDYGALHVRFAGSTEVVTMQYKAGDKIEHRLMPGFTMTVLDARPCETDANRSEPHFAYQVTDPEGNADWLCAYDVQRPGQGRAWA